MLQTSKNIVLILFVSKQTLPSFCAEKITGAVSGSLAKVGVTSPTPGAHAVNRGGGGRQRAPGSPRPRPSQAGKMAQVGNLMTLTWISWLHESGNFKETEGGGHPA